MAPRYTSFDDLKQLTEDQIIDFYKRFWKVEDFIFEGTYSKLDSTIREISPIGEQRRIFLPFVRKPLIITVPNTIDIPNGRIIFTCRHQVNTAHSFQVIKKSIKSINASVDTNKLPAKKVKHELKTHTIVESLVPTYEKLLDEWFNNKTIVGAYCIQNGEYFIKDLRSRTFIERKYLDDSEIIIKLENPIDQLEEDNYYEFKWTLIEDDSERGYSIAPICEAGFKPIDPKTLVHNLYKIWDKNNEDAVHDIKKIMHMVSTQLTASSDGTFIYELLQNANDYPIQVNGKDQDVDVEFRLTDNFLIYRHTGKIFSPLNIAAISKLAAGEKAKKKNAIGYKGIGFKTVFDKNNFVYMRSGDYSLRFDESAVSSKKPWQVMPIWTEDEEVDQEIKRVFNDNETDYRVQMAIRPTDASVLRDGEKNYEYIFNDIFKDERDIAFIPNIRSVKVFVEGEKTIECTKNSSNWLITLDPYKYTFLQEETNEINAEIAKNKRIPEKYKDFKDTYVSFACLRDGDVLKPVPDSRLYCYLPTQISLGLPFLMNTDMIPTGPRDDIEKKIQFNHKLIVIAGKKLVEWLKDLLSNGEYDLDSVFSLVPSFDPTTNYEDFIKEFEDGFDSALECEDFIPIEDNDELSLCPIEKIIYDTTRISESGIFSDSELLGFANGADWTSYDDEHFPHKLLRGKPYFTSFMEKYHSEDMEFSTEHLLAMCSKTDFQSWLKNQENNNKFIDFLLQNNYLDLFIDNDKAIFIGNDGNLHLASSLYYDIDEHLKDLSCFADDYLPRLSSGTREYFKDDEDWEEYISHFAKFDCDEFVSDVIDDDDMLELLEEKKNSIAFIHFLAQNDVENDNLIILPFIDVNDEMVDSYERLVFFESKRGKEIKSCEWINDDWIAFISNDYFSVDAEMCIEYLKNQFGVKDYEDSVVIESIVEDADKIAHINEKLQVMSTAVPFMDFVCDNAESFAEGSLEKFNVIVFNKDGEECWGPSEGNEFLLSPLFEEYDAKSWVSNGWMYSVSEDYFKGKDQAYIDNLKTLFKNAFGIKDFTVESFIDHILLENITDLKTNLEDIDCNIDFWRWAKERCKDKTNELMSLPIIASNGEDNESDYILSDNSIYMPDALLPEGQYIESIVKKYYDDALFVIERYAENSTASCKKEWRVFFEGLGIMSEQTELVFDQIIPNLDEIEDPGVPGMLAKAKELFQDYNIQISDLTSLRLEKKDGEYANIADCLFITAKKTDEPFKCIELTDECLLSQFNAETRSLILEIAEEAGATIIENLADWRAEKLSLYLERQDNSDIDSKDHYQIVEEILNMDDGDRKDLSEDIHKIQLLSKDGEYCSQSDLTLGSAYRPLCDFESNGITRDFLTYLSEEYSRLNCEGIGKKIRSAFKIHYRFTDDDIQLLSNYKFADFFWRVFVPHPSAPIGAIKNMIEEGKFDDMVCVPTPDGSVAAAEELYSRDELKDYMKLVVDWTKSYPCDDYPEQTYEILKLLKFKDSLSFFDGLNALKCTEDQAKRYNILKWMLDDYDSSDNSEGSHTDLINEYRNHEKAIWRNRVKKKCHIRDLYALDVESKPLEQYLKLHPRIISDDYFTKYPKSTFYEECDMLQIKYIRWEDMDFRPTLAAKNDDTLKDKLRNYLLFVAAMERPDEWSEYYNTLCERFDSLEFNRCRSISLTYKEDASISQTAKKFHYDDAANIFYYVGEWHDRLVFTDFIVTLRDVLDSDLDRDMFLQIFEPKFSLQELESFANDNCVDLAYDENFKTILKQQLGVCIDSEEFEEDEDEPELKPVVSRPLDSVQTSNIVIDESENTLDENDDEDSFDEDVNELYDEVLTKDIEDPQEDTFEAPNVGRPTGIIQSHGSYTTHSSDVDIDEVEDVNEDDDEDDETLIRMSVNRNPVSANSGAKEKKPHGAFKGNWTQASQDSPTVRQKRNYSGYSPDKFKSRQFDAGEQEPMTLSRRDISNDEIKYLSNLFGRALNIDTIKDENYIVRMRFYNSLKENGLAMEKSEYDYIAYGSKEVKTKSGKYIHRCSARGGILFISPSVWNRLREGRWVICFYSGKMADQFVYIRTQEELMKIINQDALVIQVTGNDKRELVDKIYEDGFYGMSGNIYTLIRTIKVEGEITPFDENITDHYSDDDDQETDDNV